MSMDCAARTLFALLVCASVSVAQTVALSGHVYDDSGALVPGARITITGPERFSRTVTSSADGAYAVTGMAPGQYAVIASATALGMAQPERITLVEPVQTLDLRLKVVTATAQMNVQDNVVAVSTDATNNASATILAGDDLQSLSDDPEDLQADLEALAGPSAGPGGGSAIFIDGFSGGQLPPKESIREVRINQNPFSPEFDKLGLGRIEIFTKPGTDKYHGTITYNLGTDWWNSRNPYATQKAPFLLQETENSFSGPVTKHSSFTFDLERQAVDNGSVTNGVILDPASLAPTPFSSVLKTPQRHLRFGPHVDYQLNANNYLSLRYTLTRATIQDAGIGGFDLISRGYYRLNTFNTVQFIETSIHGAAVNETRFQYFRFGNAQTANTQAPEIQVLGAFNGGGASSLHSRDVQSSYELQNNTSIVHGPHFLRFGTRLRKQGDNSLYPQNFPGTFTFTGELAPELDANNQEILNNGQPVLVQISSIEQYRRTVLGLPASLGGGASQFTRSAGNPTTMVNQFDAAVFAGDDWRLRPNFTLSLGLRFETQTNIHDRADIAPRLGFAWAPGTGTARNKPGKYVVRGGFGVFYDRFALGNTLTAQRYNGIVQQQYVLTNPGFYLNNIPSLSALGANPASQSVWEVDSHLHSPYLLQSAMTLERQLPKNTTLALTYTNVHALHILRSADINAPLAGAYPYPSRGPIFLMTSSGLYNQNQFIANLNSKINSAVSVYATWVLNKALSNSDGLSTFPANPYSSAGEYGPASTDIRNRFTLGGTINTRWNIRFNPLVSYQSGAPFNITSGEDPYGTTIFSARPGIVTDASRPGVVRTPYGLLDPNPLPGEKLIGRNAGRGPAQIMVNLRVQKIWSFGRERGASGASSERSSGGGGGGGAGGLVPPNPTPAVFSSSSVSRRYNLSLGMSGRNLFNHTNPGPIIGDITSPLFGRANQIAGTPNGEGFLETAGNRRLEMQVRFTF